MEFIKVGPPSGGSSVVPNAQWWRLKIADHPGLTLDKFREYLSCGGGHGFCVSTPNTSTDSSIQILGPASLQCVHVGFTTHLHNYGYTPARYLYCKADYFKKGGTCYAEIPEISNPAISKEFHSIITELDDNWCYESNGFFYASVWCVDESTQQITFPPPTARLKYAWYSVQQDIASSIQSQVHVTLTDGSPPTQADHCRNSAVLLYDQDLSLIHI